MNLTRLAPPAAFVLALSACGGGGGGTPSLPGGSSSTGSPSVPNYALNGVAYGNGLFVGAGINGSDDPLIETSTDGVNWKAQDSHDTATINGFSQVVFGTPGFLALDQDNNVFFSPDGVNWTNTTPQTLQGHTAFSLSWDGAEYLIASNVNADTIYTSPDGTTWTTLAESVSGDPAQGSIMKLGGTWYGVGRDGDIATSTDLVTWTPESIPFYSAGNGFDTLFYANKQFIAAGLNGLLATSADGQTWTNLYNPSVTTQGLNAVASNGSAYVAVGVNASVLYSQDGIHWQSVDISSLVPTGVDAPNFMAVAAQPGGNFVVVGPTLAPGAVEITSADGLHWTAGKP